MTNFVLHKICNDGKDNDCDESVDEGGVCCQCDSGICCDGCYYRPSSYVCRSSVGVCDVQEKCTGYSTSCPSNSYKPSGTYCGTQDCDTNNKYYITGTQGATKTSYCKLEDYVDCERTCTGSSALCPACSCGTPSTLTTKTAGICKYISGCSGSTAGIVVDYADGTSCGSGYKCEGGECKPDEASLSISDLTITKTVEFWDVSCYSNRCYYKTTITNSGTASGTLGTEKLWYGTSVLDTVNINQDISAGMGTAVTGSVKSDCYVSYTYSLRYYDNSGNEIGRKSITCEHPP